jgi:hypothetical protein
MFRAYEMTQTCAVVIDENCEPESFNRAFFQMVGTKDKFTIKNILEAIQIYRMDKITRS